MEAQTTNYNEFRKKFMTAIESGELKLPEEMKDSLTEIDIATVYVVGIAQANGVPALTKDELMFMIGIFAPDAMMKGESNERNE